MVVLTDFVDLQDNNHVYHAGDPFPRTGTVSEERIAELSGSDNALGIPLIAKNSGEKPKKKGRRRAD